MPPVHDTLTPRTAEMLLTTGALLEGHFELSSGLHSPRYLQAMRLLQHPGYALEIAAEVAKAGRFPACDVVLAPALGGIVWGFAVAQQFPKCRSLFAERVDGLLALRRGFEIREGERVLLAEDVITTGGTTMELRALAEEAGAKVVGVAAVVDRSGGKFAPDVPFAAWIALAIETWTKAECPLCANRGIATKPGSRPPRSAP